MGLKVVPMLKIRKDARKRREVSWKFRPKQTRIFLKMDFNPR